MSKEVRNIFLILIGTVVIILTSALFIEMVNINTSGMQVQQVAKLSCRQSLTLFAQETYKVRTGENSTGGSINMNNLVDCNGNFYITGNFYGDGNATEIYNSIYNSSDFTDWVKNVSPYGEWDSISLLDKRLNGTFQITEPPVYETYVNTYGNDSLAYDEYEKDMDLYSDYSTADGYVKTFMTPLNFGVPYLDKTITEKMFKWNLTQMFSNCSKDMIVVDDNGVQCIASNGFLIYASQAKITNINYRIFDLTNTSDAQDFMELTNINPDNLKFDDIINFQGNDDERKRICIAGIDYSVPIAYQGITPLKRLYSFLWDYEVNGLNNTSSNLQGYNSNAQVMQGGGYTGNSALPVPGKIIYYVVR